MFDKHQFDKTILREYDIRGIVGQTLRESDAYAVGRSFGTLVRAKGGKRVAVGYDGRTSSPSFEAALVQGLHAAGIDTVQIGMGPTPMLYYAVHELAVDGGIQVTGSHNPPSHNGFKLMLGRSSFYGESIQKLAQIAEKGQWQNAETKGKGVKQSVEADYSARMLRDLKFGRAMSCVWDCGNGATGDIVRKLVPQLPGKHHLLFAEIDGRFPNHHPDPTEPKNLVDLQRAMEQQGADLGFAFDGDGDRIGMVDNRGQILWGDQILSLLAAPILARLPGATVIADIKASQGLFDEIARLGGTPLMWRTGHSLIKAKLKETNAPLAGEMSGHIFIADNYYGFDDAVYVALRMLELVSNQAQSLSQMTEHLPKWINTPELRFDCSDQRKFEVIAEVKQRIRLEQSKGMACEINEIDGLRLSTSDGWWLLRASNTQAVLVARAESHSSEGLLRLKQQLRSQLAASNIDFPE
ncbi:MAG: phosphomannomutase/phosphoglucomutase [Candidatus Pacebacteria bacterium]|nr:phosphomannomutase/phosphoglucomutase [Candidatus Paceibacterota bacterium]